MTMACSETLNEMPMMVQSARSPVISRTKALCIASPRLSIESRYSGFAVSVAPALPVTATGTNSGWPLMV